MSAGVGHAGGQGDYDQRMGLALLTMCRCQPKVETLFRWMVSSSGAVPSDCLAHLSTGEQLIALIAFDLFRGTGKLGRAIHTLDSDHFHSVLNALAILRPDAVSTKTPSRPESVGG